MSKFERESENYILTLKDFMEELIYDNEAVTNSDILFEIIEPNEENPKFNIRAYWLGDETEIAYTEEGWDTKKHLLSWLQTNEILLVDMVQELPEKSNKFKIKHINDENKV